jgi:hypothetical protein
MSRRGHQPALGEIVSRDEAKARGLTRYFTNVPCINGHVCQRYVSSRDCVECSGIKAAPRLRKWRESKRASVTSPKPTKVLSSTRAAVRSRKKQKADPEKNRERNLSNRINNRPQYLAHKAVENAVAAGRLIQWPCEICGSNDLVHAHHDDYEKPLEVIWLCPQHHRLRHKELDAIRETG